MDTRMSLFTTALPIDDALPALTQALRTRDAAVLVAPPGAGKTTRVPLVLADEPWAQGPNGGRKVLVLEPRRIAARAAAGRMAKTLRAGGGRPQGEGAGGDGRRDGRLPGAVRLQGVAAHPHRGGDRGRVHPPGA